MACIGTQTELHFCSQVITDSGINITEIRSPENNTAKSKNETSVGDSKEAAATAKNVNNVEVTDRVNFIEIGIPPNTIIMTG